MAWTPPASDAVAAWTPPESDAVEKKFTYQPPFTPAPPKSWLQQAREDFTAPISGAWQSLKSDAATSMNSPSEFERFSSTGKVGLDLLGLATSPIAGAINAAVARPVGEGLARIPGVALPGQTQDEAVSDAMGAVNAASNAARLGSGTNLASLMAKFPPTKAAKVASAAGESVTKPQAKALDIIAGRMIEDAKATGTAPQEVLAKVISGKERGSPVTLADMSGRNVKELAGNVARRPGAGRNVISQFLTQRDEAAGERLSGAVKSLVSTKSLYPTIDEITARQVASAMPLKREAFLANQQVESPVIDRLLTRPDMRKAFRMAVEDMQNQGKLVSVSDAELTELAKEQGITTGRGVGKGLKLEVLDYTKRALDRLIRAYKQHPETGDYATAVQLRQDLVRAMDEADVTAKAGPNSLKPEGGAYKRYRDSWSEGARAKDAMELGEGFSKMAPEESAKELAKLSPAEREYARVGVANSLLDEISKTPWGADQAKRVLRSPEVARRLRPFFDNEKQFQQFIDTVTDERLMFEAKQDILGNSRTQARAAEDSESLDLATHMGKAALHAASGNKLSALMSLMKLKRDLGLRNNPELNLQIARILTDTNLPSRSTLSRLIENRLAPRPGPPANSLLSIMRPTEPGRPTFGP